jgi:hypothetical protein
MEPNTFLHNGPSYALGNITTGNSYLTTTDYPFTLGTGYAQTTPSNTISFNTPINYSTTQNNKIMQNKVAVFKVTRDEDNKITNTEFIKELWVQTKNNQSVDFQVARDKDLADYDANDLIIKTILTVTF